jgi:tetratricopeptide (TPR) repeat protein
VVGKSLGKARPNQKLREAREVRGWRLKDVVAAVQSLEAGSHSPGSGHLGLDENTISRWERGVIQPTDFYRARLCVAFDVERPGELGWDASPRLLAEIEDVRSRREPSTRSTRATWRQQSEIDVAWQLDGDSDRRMEWILNLAQSRGAMIDGRVPAQPADRSATLLMFDSARPEIWLAVAHARSLKDNGREAALVSALWPYWSIRALLADARFAIQTALHRVGSGEDRQAALLLNAEGEIARYQGATQDAIAAFTASRELWLVVGDRERQAQALNNRGSAHIDLGDLDRAEQDCRAALALQDRVRLVLGAAYCEANLSYVLALKERAQEAVRLSSSALRTFEAYGYEPGVADASIPLALAVLRQGAADAARRQLRQSLAITARLGYRWNTVQALEGMAIVEGETGRMDSAARYLAEATDLRLDIGSRRPVFWQALLDARGVPDDPS